MMKKLLKLKLNFLIKMENVKELIQTLFPVLIRDDLYWSGTYGFPYFSTSEGRPMWFA